MPEESSKSDELNIKDKRRFNPDGTVRQDDPSLSDSTEKKSPPEPEVKKDSKQEFQVNFATFILSLASSVQINLGLIPHPATNKPEKNLVSARQTIDILGMLEEKTKGNLDANESALLKQVLFELRMQYVERTKK